jgi:hypothetical protein
MMSGWSWGKTFNWGAIKLRIGNRPWIKIFGWKKNL